MMDDNFYQLSNDILRQSDIVEVISSRIKVEKKGRNYVAICPFHNDKNPSLMISKEKQIFKCFVCNTSGNAINFIEKYDKVSYFQAMKEVAKICGINDNRLNANIASKQISPELSTLYKCLTDINNFYQASLYQSENGKKALNYLYNRKLSDDVIKYFNIGYSLDDGINIVNFLKAKGYSIKTIERTGIGRIRDNMSIYDSNASRVVFALKDESGQVCGFSARRLNDVSDEPKYINTGATDAFNKGNILYNLCNAETSARQLGFVYLLEGFMDVIALYRAGIKNAIALMGTALTSNHLQLLKKLNCEVRICLDLDNAGQINTYNIISKFDENNVHYKIVNPIVDFKEKDSDEIIDQYGKEKLLSFLNNLIEKPEWLISYYSKNLDLNSSYNKKELVKNLMKEIIKLKSKFDVEDYINKLYSLTGYSKQLLYEYYNKLLTANKNNLSSDDLEIDFNKYYNNDILKGKELVQFKIVRYMFDSIYAIDDYARANIFLPTLKYRNIVKLLNEYVDGLKERPASINLNEFINYVESNKEIEDKDFILKNIANIALNDVTLPPYSINEMQNQFKSLEKIRQEEKENKTFNVELQEASSIEEKANLYKILIEKKRKKLIK